MTRTSFPDSCACRTCAKFEHCWTKNEIIRKCNKYVEVKDKK